MTELRENIGEIRVKAHPFRLPAGITRLFDRLANERHNLFSAAANAVQVLVRGHLARESQVRHTTADSLGGQRTGHLEKGARSVYFEASADYGEVIIPVPGISRAFGDVTITPTGAAALTIPVSPWSYGHRASELTALGWKLFRTKGEKSGRGILFGERDGKVEPLYVLKKRVQQRQDRSLLPSDADITRTAAKAIIDWVGRAA